jgi:catechol 2,3-dioxygenase-like lactoylglutathione lyase family enzyme
MIARIDHFVLTVRSLETTLSFYERVLGLRRTITSGSPASLHFGQQKINVHESGHEFAPNARSAAPGSADFCLITNEAIETVQAHVETCGVTIELGPAPRNGALGAMTSIYFRDPDGNLIEVSRYASE